MTYTFSKASLVNTKNDPSNYISKERYTVNNENSEIGQYVITEKMDHFNFCNPELEMYSINHIPINRKHLIINELTKTEMGHFEKSEQIDGAIINYGQIIIQNNIYNCMLLQKSKYEVDKSLMISNDNEQVFINYTEKRNKIDTNCIEIVNGKIEMKTENLLLLFVSIYFLEDVLFKMISRG
jgi:hypothetical protein